jgi:hypothetical protein
MHLLWHLLLNYINLLVWFFFFLAIVFSIISFGFEFLLIKGTESCLACHTNLSKQGHQVSCGCQLFFCKHHPPFSFYLWAGSECCWAVFAIMLVGYNLDSQDIYVHLTGEICAINCWLAIFDLDRGGYKLSWRRRQIKRQARISLKLGLCMKWFVIFPTLHLLLYIDHDLLVFCRNKGITNVITIDLHGQHVKQAMRVLKLHLLFGTYVRCKHLPALPYFYADLPRYSILLCVMNICRLVPAIQTLRVITGCGSRGLGKSKVKQAVWTLPIPLPANLLSYIGKLVG